MRRDMLSDVFVVYQPKVKATHSIGTEKSSVNHVKLVLHFFPLGMASCFYRSIPLCHVYLVKCMGSPDIALSRLYQAACERTEADYSGQSLILFYKCLLPQTHINKG